MQSDALSFEDLPVARRRLRVGLVTETYPPEINGVAMTLGRLVAGLQARDHQIQLIRPRQRDETSGAAVPNLEQILRPGFPIPRYAGLNMGLPAKRLLGRMWATRRPDIVHIATEGPLGWSALAAARKLRIPVVSGFHTNFHSYSSHYGLGWLKTPIHAYLRKFHNHAHMTLVPTARLRDELISAGYHDVEVLARGVDASLFNPAKRSPSLRREWGVGESGLAVAYVGRIAPEKNLDLLIRAFEAIENVCPSARLILVGDGPELAAMRQSQPRFIYRGVRVGESLAEHYASADIFLFPSTTETFGNSLTEAMASGLATISFDYAASAECVRHAENGLQAPLGDDNAFITRCRWLATNRSAIAELGANARATAEALSWEAIHARLEALYLGLLERPDVVGQVSPRRFRFG